MAANIPAARRPKITPYLDAAGASRCTIAVIHFGWQVGAGQALTIRGSLNWPIEIKIVRGPFACATLPQSDNRQQDYDCPDRDDSGLRDIGDLLW